MLKKRIIIYSFKHTLGKHKQRPRHRSLKHSNIQLWYTKNYF